MSSKNDAIQSKCESTQYVAGGRLIGSATKTSSTEVPTERDPLLLRVSNFNLYYSNTQVIIRTRCKLPETVQQNYHSQHRYHSGDGQQVMWSGKLQPSRGSRSDPSTFPQRQAHLDCVFNSTDSTYEIYIENENDNDSHQMTRSGCSENSQQSRRDNQHFVTDKLQQYYNKKANRFFSGTQTSHDPELLDIPTEIFAVRRAALTVFDPLTYTWVSNNFILTALLLLIFVSFVIITYPLINILMCPDIRTDIQRT